MQRHSVGGGSLRPAWASLRSLSSSLRGSQRPGHNQAASLHSGVAESSGTAGSLNSLADGRTPWPIPWIEAIFLPEYPNRGHVTEKSFNMLGTIAKGAFGKVFRVSLKDQHERIFAMKVQSKSDVISQNAVNQMKEEVSIHESVGGCQFIARLYASWQSRSKLFTVLQYATGYGDLWELSKDTGPLPEAAVKIYALEIAIGLDYLHSSSVIYRDLKLENVVLDDHGHVQLVDFGLAKWLAVGDRTRTICGTLGYMAPEVAAQDASVRRDGGEGYDHSVDWWSLAVLLHILLTGKRAFPSAGSHVELEYPAYQPPPAASEPMKALLAKMLTMEPEERVRGLQAFQDDPVFADLDPDLIAEKKIHPNDHIPRMRRCESHNDVQGSYMDTEEELAPFAEGDQFTFTEVDYANSGAGFLS